MKPYARITVAVGLALLLGACAHRPVHDPADPLESVNRKIFAFNNTVDQYVARPVAQVYVDTVPRPARRGLGNFVSNLGQPLVIVNELLQAKWLQAVKTTGRFLFNSTVGLAGFLDPASDIGLTPNREDFGQTLGHWGVGEGWFLMLPFLGPTTNRDLVGRLVDIYADPILHVDIENRRNIWLGVSAVDLLDTRAALLGSERLLEQQFDPYIFLRSAYLERRRQLVHDGNAPADEWDYDEDWDDDAQ